mmetsp:Transcript_12259/g.30522  ORF Transcript_12259/g.30522 Transcript_12259/m.30522 type:complete len:88 (-) Transcript_12259:1861-2124(-)
MRDLQRKALLRSEIQASTMAYNTIFSKKQGKGRQQKAVLFDRYSSARRSRRTHTSASFAVRTVDSLFVRGAALATWLARGEAPRGAG